MIKRLALLPLVVAVTGLACSGQGAALGPHPTRVRLRPATDLDNFYMIVGSTFNVPELCGRISPLADGGGGAWSPPGYQITTMRSRCFAMVAAGTHNSSLCDQVTPVISGPFDGSKIDKEDCLAHRQMNDHSPAVPDIDNMDPFIRQLRRLGYGDHEVVESAWQENERNSATYAAYEKLRDDPQFLARVEQGRSFKEERSEPRARAAHALEFLFQMIAVDRTEPSLCERISPNATFSQSGRTAWLQSRCYLYLAWNTRDAALCEPLPHARTSPLINEVFDSQEVCRKTAAIYRRPVFKTPPHYDPEPFPHAADFGAALQELGFASEFVARQVAPPEPRAYWDFVLRLRYRARAEDRDEFVRRVIGLH